MNTCIGCIEDLSHVENIFSFNSTWASAWVWMLYSTSCSLPERVQAEMSVIICTLKAHTDTHNNKAFSISNCCAKLQTGWLMWSPALWGPQRHQSGERHRSHH